MSDMPSGPMMDSMLPDYNSSEAGASFQEGSSFNDKVHPFTMLGLLPSGLGLVSLLSNSVQPTCTLVWVCRGVGIS